MPIHPSANPAPGHPEQLGHSEFLRRLQFVRGAPSALKQAAASGNTAEFVRQWFLQLGHRTDSRSLALPERAFDWIAVQSGLASAWRSRSGRRPRRPVIGGHSQARSPLPAIARLEPDDGDGDLLAGLALLTRPPSPVRRDQWLAAWRTCISLTATRPLSPELAFTTGLLLAPLKGTSQLRQDGRRGLQQELLEWTDTDGTPHAELFEQLPEWLGTLVRATCWGNRFAASPWNRPTSKRFARLVDMVSPLYRRRDRLALSHRPARGLRDLLASAASLTGPPGQPPVSQSDWARVAVLRSDRTSDAPAVIVTHDGPMPRLDVSCRGRSLLSDEWSLDVTSDKRSWSLEHWECVCWQSDEDADYIELQAHDGDDRRVDRHILLSRAEELLVLADSVIAGPGMSEHERLDCRSGLALAEGISARPAGKGRRDWRLVGAGASARVFPLAIPDDPRLATGPASITCQDNHLAWAHASPGPALFLPLVIDFSTSGRRLRPEWNPLTVTEERQVVSPHRAAGYRLRLGNVQLVIYRSLATPQTPRSVIGQHSNHETMIGMLRPDGEFSPLVLVE